MLGYTLKMLEKSLAIFGDGWECLRDAWDSVEMAADVCRWLEMLENS